jgi:DNA-binding transcriptional MerR regulator
MIAVQKTPILYATRNQASRLLGEPESNIRRWEKRGLICPDAVAGSIALYLPQTVKRLQALAVRPKPLL